MKNPKRVAAGKLNRTKRNQLSEAALNRLRDAALRHRPWERSTGPRSANGKSKVGQNARKRKTAVQPSAELQVQQAALQLLKSLRAISKSHFIDRERIVIESGARVADQLSDLLQTSNRSQAHRLSAELLDNVIEQ